MTEKEMLNQLMHLFNNNKLHVKRCIQMIINANPHGNPLNSDGESTLKYWDSVKHLAEELK